MSQKSSSGPRPRHAAKYYLARLRERLWLRPMLSCVLSLFAAFVAGLADEFEQAAAMPDMGADTIKILLTILSSSMLVISVFAVGAMLSAYASASHAATPRSFPLVVADDVSQNALSTFIGAFIFSIVALTALLNGYYAQAGRFVLFLLTVVVFALVIISFVRWVDRIARLGQLGNTIRKVEDATDEALKSRAKHPTLGAARATSVDQGTALYPTTVGYIQGIDIGKLEQLAQQLDCKISVCALPGTFVTPASPVAHITSPGPTRGDHAAENLIEAFVIGRQRTFESDPRFGLIVLSEIASRALSPAMNDPGTAIDIIGSLVRLFVRWSEACESSPSPPTEYDRVAVMAISVDDMFDDAFNAIARDGASTVEVAIRLQEAFHSLAQLRHVEIRRSATSHAGFALAYAEQDLQMPAEREAVRSVALRGVHGRTGDV